MWVGRAGAPRGVVGWGMRGVERTCIRQRLLSLRANRHASNRRWTTYTCVMGLAVRRLCDGHDKPARGWPGLHVHQTLGNRSCILPAAACPSDLPRATHSVPFTPFQA